MFHLQVSRVSIALLLSAFPLLCAESDALDIDAVIGQRHMPFGTILNPIFASDRVSIAAYTRGGDSALWTGHYLAAEAYRYRVTRSPEALANVRAALAGLTLLVDVTGRDLLARCAVPADSPYAAGIRNEESVHGSYPATLNGRSWIWIGHTSRDQYSGVFFGLGTAFDLVSDPAIRASIAALATRLLKKLMDWDWNIVMPDGSASTTFIIRPDQQLALLQVGRHVNPQRFESEYSSFASTHAFLVSLPLAIDSADVHSSYFKFNLAYINLFSLLRLEKDGSTRRLYENAYSVVRGTTRTHKNAHFNMIDRALHGPDEARDNETRQLLDAWLERPRGDFFVDWRGRIPTCGDPENACSPIPVAQRPPSDFVWQTNPFQMLGGGAGLIETAGIDYILPYWMARYYRVLAGGRPIRR